MDEKAAGRGHDYITVVTDLEPAPSSTWPTSAEEPAWTAISSSSAAEQLAGIEAVAMDMWEPYANSVRAHLEDADDKIVFDRFHIMKYMVGAVDTVRKRSTAPCGRRRQAR